MKKENDKGENELETILESLAPLWYKKKWIVLCRELAKSLQNTVSLCPVFAPRTQEVVQYMCVFCDCVFSHDCVWAVFEPMSV